MRFVASCYLGTVALAAALLLFSLSAPRHPRQPSVEVNPQGATRPVGVGVVIDAFSDEGVLQRFRIDSVEHDPNDRDGDVRLYRVSMHDQTSDRWRPYCLPDIEGRAVAIPVQGSWTATGEPEPRPHAITFACTSGAIAKCIRFGYKPWAMHNGVSLAPYHAACMRMVRADYCGDGRPHTVDGTRINIWDELGIQSRDQELAYPPEVFEAAWGPKGAVYLNLPRWSDDVTRVIKECPEQLRGRTSQDRKLTPLQVQQQFPEALIFNARFIPNLKH